MISPAVAGEVARLEGATERMLVTYALEADHEAYCGSPRPFHPIGLVKRLSDQRGLLQDGCLPVD